MNKEFDLANKYIESSGQNPLQCPTCRSLPFDLNFPGERNNGTYRYLDQEWECDCDTQIKLRRHYALACIPYQYMILDWDDYEGPHKVRAQVADYIENFDAYKAHGMGVEFYAVELGVGKTFAAIHVGKELIKREVRVHFIEFKDVVSGLVDEQERRNELKDRLMAAHVLILDEIKTGYSDAQKHLFSEMLETVIRHRTNWNMPTIITTNLTHEDLNNFYPRIYSLLSAKQHQIFMPGKDRRDNMIREDNEYFAKAKEVKPIT